MKEKMTITFEDDDGVEHELPGKFILCHTCDGKGSQALHGIAIPMDEFMGPDWDDESRQAYFDGDYDTVCPTCHGKRVMLVIDTDACPKKLLKQYEAFQDAIAETDAIEAQERRMEAWAAGERD